MEHMVAENLSMSVAGLRECMSHEEFLGWVAFYRVRDQKREMAQLKAAK